MIVDTTTMQRLEQRYNDDLSFRAMVDTMAMLYSQLHLEPGEFRDAAVFAVHLVEMRTLRPTTLVRR